MAVRQAHSDSAAFSAGLVYGLLRGWQMDACLMLACVSGTLRCERAHHEPVPTLDELHAVIGLRDRLVSAAYLYCGSHERSWSR